MEDLHFKYTMILILLSLFLIIYFSFSSQKKISEDFYLKYSLNPYVSKGYHQLLGIPVPNDCPSCLSCPQEPKITVYEHCDYQGRSVEMGVGTHDYNFINSKGFNDIISSIKVPSGLKVIAWEHNPGGGRSWTFESDNSCIVNIGANDTISSIIVSKTTIIYKNAMELGNFNMSPWNMRDPSLERAKWIWNIPNAEYNAPVNVYIWFYFAFYTDIVRTLTLSAVTDNVGTLYLNDGPGRDISGGWMGNIHKKGVIGSSIIGFNYVKVCAFNQGGPAGLLVNLQSPQGNVISTNGSWLTTNTNGYLQKQPVPVARFVILGVGTDGQLWVKKSLDPADRWRRVNEDKINDLISISVGADGRSIIGVTKNFRIIKKNSWSDSTWSTISNNCCVTSIGMDREGRIFGLGTDRKVWTKDSLDGSWTQRASSGENGLFLSVGVNSNELYMIDMNSVVYKKTIPVNINNLASTSWYPFMNLQGIKGYVRAHDNTELLIDSGSQITTLTSNGFFTNQNSCCVNSVCKPISFGDPDV